MEHYITIGEIIKYYRTQQGLSQEALSSGICTRKYLGNIERNLQIPTLDMINQLSNRLGINLYDSYALMLQHHDIDTHNKIEKLIHFLSGETAEELIELINEYKGLPSFQKGEPLQYIKYASSLYTANRLNNKESAISLALEGLSVNEPFNIDSPDSNRTYSNIEMSLLNTIAVNYCRIDNKNEAKKYFELIRDYMMLSFEQSHYATNRNNQFEIKFFANHICNYFLFFRDVEEIPLETIDNVLILLKELDNHHMLPELLLCKTYLLMQKEREDEAKELYVLAHKLGNYLYNPEYQTEHNEKYLLREYYNQLSGDSVKH